jgi:hypothetical protein
MAHAKSWERRENPVGRKNLSYHLVEPFSDDICIVSHLQKWDWGAILRRIPIEVSFADVFSGVDMIASFLGERITKSSLGEVRAKGNSRRSAVSRILAAEPAP